MAELATFVEARREPTGPVETYSTEIAAETVTREIATEDAAIDPAPLRERRPRRGQHQPDQRRPQELAPVRDRSARDASVAWDSEQPDQMWIGHRERPNEILIKNPALMGPAGRAAAALPGRPRRGLRRHVRGPFPGRLRRHRRRPARRPARLSDLRRRPRRDARQRRDRRERPARPLGRRRSRAGPGGRPPWRHDPMRLGLLTAPFPETPLMDVVDWTAANGFESIEIACWPRTTGPTRRYAGTVPHRRREPVGRPGVRARRPRSARRA